MRIPVFSVSERGPSMSVCILLICFGFISAACFLHQSIRRSYAAAVLLKSLASTLFVITGICACSGSVKMASADILVLSGLIFGLLGDIWLGLRPVIPKEDSTFLYSGFSAFSVGHILFMIGLILGFGSASRPVFLILPFILAALASTGFMLLEKPMQLDYGQMRIVCFIYGFLLFAMLFTTGSLMLVHGFRSLTLNLFSGGAVLFVLSDLILSRSFFGKGHNRPADQIANILTYYAAQFLIAFSLLFLH